MSEISYPKTQPYESQVNSWLKMIIHEPVKNMAQDESKEFGDEIVTCKILAPQNLIENNVANYESTDFKLSSAAVALMQGSWSLSAFGNAMVDTARIATEGMIGAEVGRMLGSVVNPRSEQFFKGPGFRTFTFHWEMAPPSAEDASAMEAIYRTVRKYSYPTLEGGTTEENPMIYGMPAEFELQYLVDYGDGEIEVMDPKFGKTVVTNISLNYTGAGINIHSNHAGGVPPFVNMDITFVERTLLNRESDPIAEAPENGG